MDEPTNDGYQVIVANIKWHDKVSSTIAKKTNKEELPDQMSIDIPVGVLVETKKKPSEEKNIIEQFVYNLLYKKYGREVNRCQIWLPL